MPSTYNLRSRVNGASTVSAADVSAAKTLLAFRCANGHSYPTRSSTITPHVPASSTTNSSRTFLAPGASIALRVKKNPRFERVDYTEMEF